MDVDVNFTVKDPGHKWKVKRKFMQYLPQGNLYLPLKEIALKIFLRQLMIRKIKVHNNEDAKIINVS